MKTRTLLLATVVIGLTVPAIVRAQDDPLAAWRKDVRISVVSSNAQAHTIHSYFNTSPESPDGRSVLFFKSTASDGHMGQ
ncbi:MAG TPA: hypothetical protein VK968_09405, partial [Roseimicrobium sp.]|nr:hypothetical protein [Roseimicrobium sp.]